MVSPILYACGDCTDLRKPLNRNLHVISWTVICFSQKVGSKNKPNCSNSVHDIYTEQNTDFLNFKVFTGIKQNQTFYGLRTHLNILILHTITSSPDACILVCWAAQCFDVSLCSFSSLISLFCQFHRARQFVCARAERNECCFCPHITVYVRQCGGSFPLTNTNSSTADLTVLSVRRGLRKGTLLLSR